MAESKSDKFANDINMHSEKIAKFEPLSTNRLAPDSECAYDDERPIGEPGQGVRVTAREAEGGFGT
jgi:hypothetical protein